MAGEGGRAYSDIRRINEIICELEAILQELPYAMTGFKTDKLERDLKNTISRYREVRNALYRIG